MPVLSEELKQKITAYLPRYPSKQAVTLPPRAVVGDGRGGGRGGAAGERPRLLTLARAELHDTMSFHVFFRDGGRGLGRTRLWVCRGLACMLRGGEETLDVVCHKLGV